MKTILAFGGGVDSTALLAAHLDPAKANGWRGSMSGATSVADDGSS